MRRVAIMASLLLVVAACGTAGESSTTSTAEVAATQPAPTTTVDQASTTTGVAVAEFPATVQDDNGAVTIEARPEAVVSLSSTATEMLFAIGAGPQVVAVDNQSNYPAEAPMTEISGFTPNLEAILAFEPDLVVITFDPGDLVAGLEAAGVPVLTYTAAFTIDDTYIQMEALGAATGNAEGAAAAVSDVQEGLAEVLALHTSTGEGVTYYHEIDSTLFTATSSTYFGEIYSLFGMVNVADPADQDGSFFGYPQLSSEFVVAADPDIIFLANVLYGETTQTVSERPGWDVMAAVQAGNIAELDTDVASRWGPRIVEFAESIGVALQRFYGG